MVSSKKFEAVGKSNLLYPMVLLLMFPRVVGGLSKSECSLPSPYPRFYYQDGDLIIGAVIGVWRTMIHMLEPFDVEPLGSGLSCFLLNYNSYQNLMAFIFAINEINKNSELLPNITLGFHVVDSCVNEKKSLVAFFDLISGKENQIPNYRCGQLPNLVAFVEGISSKVSLTLASIFGLYKIPQLSFANLDPALSDKVQFPSFYRTIPNDVSQYKAIVKLIQHFGWTWIGVLVSDNETGLKASQVLNTEFKNIGACVAFLEFLPYHEASDYTKREQILKSISSSSANGFVVYGDREYVLTLHLIMYMHPIPDKVWIISCQWDVSAVLEFYFLNIQPFNGSLAFTLHSSKIPNFEKFLLGLNPDQYPNDVYIYEVWNDFFSCEWNASKYNTFPNCTRNETWRDSRYPNFYKDTAVYSNSMYNAVYAIAHSLHHMYFDKMDKHRDIREMQAWELHKYLKNVNFTNSVGDDVHFDESGDMLSDFDILNWIIFPNNTVDAIKVGEFQQDTFEKFLINGSLIRWSNIFNQMPTSNCSESCLPGQRKSPRKGQLSCCYDCVLCPDGEISNQTDMETCFKCSAEKWPNTKRDVCLHKVITYLSYEETLGSSLSIVSVILFFITCLVTMVFIKHRNTPIVRANNRDLSYTLLMSLKMCFLCNLIFIGHPLKITCILRQTVFGITFSISISSILAKTLTVVIAFNATKPGSNLKNLVGTKVANCVVIICSLTQVGICSGWLILSRPFPYYNMEIEIGKIVAECNEGSLVAFYCVLGYMGLLAFVSFLIAFMARKLPDIFNEAKYITFSMLVFCSVWISFIPAYMSTKGKYVVAVEIFAILASGSGLLCCIFIPKCYIILITPEKNTRNFVTKKADEKS